MPRGEDDRRGMEWVISGSFHRNTINVSQSEKFKKEHNSN